MPAVMANPRPRAKRVTAPLDAAARARLAVLPSSVDSSGSEHEATALSNLVNEYLLETDATVTAADLAVDQGSDAEDDNHGNSIRSVAAAAEVIQEIKGILDPAGRPDELRRRIVADVMDAMLSLEDIRKNRSAFRRAVMSRLRDRGHDAGLCKARWDKSRSRAAGNYEYIDIVLSAETRFIVDVGFAAEFEVARPTAGFDAVLAALPEVLVAPAEDLRWVVKAASAVARQSLKSRGLTVPPWRKRRFMMAKWLGPYRRTVNPLPASAGAAIVGSGAAAVCRTILGFAPRPTATSSGLWG
ncbi:uncharacterized protein LOC133900988 [Phragmites australis]|uniref:uncharacterized protein LOC133900988 n=1 Tax=Phragmites australis TaxID=29695 RepID=UPI002D797377|nr:uncharacterized protein LOC133900988 [Phragmites australis]